MGGAAFGIGKMFGKKPEATPNKKKESTAKNSAKNSDNNSNVSTPPKKTRIERRKTEITNT